MIFLRTFFPFLFSDLQITCIYNGTKEYTIYTILINDTVRIALTDLEIETRLLNLGWGKVAKKMRLQLNGKPIKVNF